jgi:hypothetical protein
MRPRLVTLAAPVATATLAIGTAAWAADVKLPFVPADRVGALAVTAQSTGPLVANDLDGTAILRSDALAPGETTTGEVTIRNAGDAAGAFTLAPSRAIDAGAPLAGPLSALLDLSVTDVTGATPVPVFSGKLATMRRTGLGTFTAGETHRYRFALSYPAGIAAEVDNLYQGASASVQFDWDATAVGGSSTQTPTPQPSGGASGIGARPVATPAVPAVPATSPAAAASIPATTATTTFKIRVTGLRRRQVQQGRLITRMSSTAASSARVTGTVSWRGHKPVKLRPATVKLTAKRRTVRLRLPAAAVQGAKRRLTVRLTIAAKTGSRTVTVRRTLHARSR